ncbi:TerB family tellurite resistance protein [Methylobacter sp. Wu8]|uniref:Putative tellurite resistance protein B-like protein n=1 Tax=Methylobacter tundripaludum TaxID=173365 RepID=A0A2S6GVK7_9GAMM|nr:TerB family tellurite resistance protein [Methylobacter tundripaludum]MCF7966886.1 TerB family tellurite resistance protein [Methylobacter tundripaludum]MCK9637786.1 TerB family tellurite resistance protein [Methylobacter tundripaludum]PPK69227.1 putative tellurite resistance protein B-like protein [Methylobacter tundripaludum]
MLNQIKLFFEQHLALSAPESTSEDKLQLATIVLFLEMMHMDDKIELKEQAVILSLIQRNFSLTAEQATALIELAEQQRKQATDYFQFTSLINKECSQEQKIRLIESLWKIAFVDGVLDMNEEYLVRKIADLLHVPHTAFIMAKNRVNEEPVL